MKISIISGKRVLTKDTGEQVRVDDGDIIRYTARFYENQTSMLELTYIETEFVGIICHYRYNHNEGYTGIYITPLLVWNKSHEKWNRIVNYRANQLMQKYFLYPHLLQLPGCWHYSHPLDYLHTCINVSLADYNHVMMTIDLEHTFENAGYDYEAIRTKNAVFREELIAKALHPNRVSQWLQHSYFDD
jgi:hypothetical protein